MASLGNKITFILPETMEEALWTTPVIGQYLENSLVSERMWSEVNIICPLLELHPLMKACWKPVEIYGTTFPEAILDVDIVFQFSSTSSYSLTKAVQKHIIEAYGVQLGTVAMHMLPPIVSTAKEVLGNLLVVGRYEWDAELGMNGIWPHQQEFLDARLKDEVPIFRCPVGLSFQQLRDEVMSASVVVGVRSTATLLAASLGKIVMELSPDHHEHKNWMSKWENPKYRMIYGPLDDMTADFVWSRTCILVKEIGSMAKEVTWVPRISQRLAVGEISTHRFV